MFNLRPGSSLLPSHRRPRTRRLGLRLPASRIEPIGGVAIVSRPAQPDARIQVLAMTLDEPRPSLPNDWRPGMPVSCDRSLDLPKS